MSAANPNLPGVGNSKRGDSSVNDGGSHRDGDTYGDRSVVSD